MQSVQLHANQLSHAFSEHDVFHQVSLRVKPGDILQIIGANGSGKSTLLKILSGLYQPSAGQLQWLDDETGALLSHHDRTKLMLFIGHQHGLLEKLSVWQSIEYLYGIFREELMQPQYIHELLGHWGLQNSHDQLVELLSFGQQKRLSLCRLQIQPASIWILDEPWVGLDHASSELLLRLIIKHTDKKGMVILTTHQKLHASQDISNWNVFELNNKNY